MEQQWHTYPCIVQFHSIELQRSCRVQIIEFRLCWVKSTVPRPKTGRIKGKNEDIGFRFTLQDSVVKVCVHKTLV